MKLITSIFTLSMVFVLTLTSKALAQQSSPNTSDPSLVQFTTKVDQLFSYLDRPDSPGCALSIIKDGRAVYKRGYGMANLEYDIPITTSSIFHVASISKQFTAMAIHLLAQDGKLSLDDNIRKYIPDVPEFSNPITIRQLIHHTSGLRDQWVLLAMAGWRWNDVSTEGDILGLIQRQNELNYKPGEEYSYVNTGYTLMGLIVKKVSGLSLRQFTEERIFKPLAMNNTHFHDDHSMVVKNRTSAYTPRQGGGWSISIPVFDNAGATSLFTTVEDLGRWDQNFYDKRVGGELLISEMLKNGALNNSDRIYYGSGLIVDKYRGLNMVAHAGSDAGYRAHILRFPDQKFTVACLCNISTIYPMTVATKVADIFLEKEFKSGVSLSASEEQLVKLSDAEMKERVGIYWNPINMEVRKLYIRDDGKLAIAGSGYELLPLSGNRLRMVNTVIEYTFEPKKDGKLPKLIEKNVVIDGDKPAVYEGVTSITLSPKQLAEYTGTYYSSELDAKYSISLQDGELIVQRKKATNAKLQPLSADTFFSTQLGYVKFARAKNGSVSEVRFSNSRARYLLFSKQ